MFKLLSFLSLWLILATVSMDAYASKIIVIRHGQADHNVNQTFNSTIKTQPPSHLTESGKKEAQDAAEKLIQEHRYQDAKICKVYTSPLPRTVQTAEILKQKIGIHPDKTKVDSRLIEIQMGILEGKHFSEGYAYIPASDPWDHSRGREYGGEILEDVRTRVGELIHEIQQSSCNGDYLLVTHGTPALALLSLLKEGDDIRLKNAEFRIVDLKN